MKFSGVAKLGSVEVNGTKIEGIELNYNTEFTCNEIHAIYNIASDIVKNLPNAMTELAKKFNEIEDIQEARRKAKEAVKKTASQAAATQTPKTAAKFESILISELEKIEKGLTVESLLKLIRGE